MVTCSPPYEYVPSPQYPRAVRSIGHPAQPPTVAGPSHTNSAASTEAKFPVTHSIYNYFRDPNGMLS